MEKLQYLSAFGIIKSSIDIPLSSYSFVVLTFLSSLLLFLMLIVEGQLFSLNILSLSSPEQIIPFNSNKLLFVTMQILNNLLLNFFKFLVAITTINSASKINNGGKPTSLRNLLNSITKSKWKGPLLTFLLMFLFTLFSLEGVLYWLAKGPLASSRNIFLQVIHGSVFALAMIKQLEYCALWNVGVVISILEEKMGFEAFWVSADLTKGNKIRGTSLMFVHDVYRVLVVLVAFDLRRKLHYSFAYEVLNISSLSLGMIINWVFCVVYYYDCKNHHREKMIVEEGGRYELVDSNLL